MTRFLCLFLLLLLPNLDHAQTITFNQGGTSQKDYHVEIPYENNNNKLIIPVVIENKTYRFLLDTGAPCVISNRLNELLKPKHLTNINITDANNKSDTMKLVSIPEFTLGGISFRDIPTLVNDNKTIFECLNIDGFIGSNMLRNSILQLSSAKKSIIITDNHSKLKLSKKQASKLLLYGAQSSPFIKIELKNKKNATEQLLFDTGMNNLYDMSQRAYDILKPTDIFTDVEEGYGNATFGIFGSSDETKNYRYKIPLVKINGTSLKNVTVETTNDENSRIGAELLNHGLVTIDYKNKYFYFEPYTDNLDLQEKQFGFKPTIANNKLVVGIIWDDAIRGTISIGDEIVQIDDVNYEKVDFCDIIRKSSPLKDKDSATIIFRNSVGDLTTLKLNKK